MVWLHRRVGSFRFGDGLIKPNHSCIVKQHFVKRGPKQMPLDKLRKILSLMNLQEVARGSGVHPNTLYRLVGGSGANYETVQKILDYLKTQGVRLDG